jgi:hypothetical protein
MKMMAMIDLEPKFLNRDYKRFQPGVIQSNIQNYINLYIFGKAQRYIDNAKFENFGSDEVEIIANIIGIKRETLFKDVLLPKYYKYLIIFMFSQKNLEPEKCINLKEFIRDNPMGYYKICNKLISFAIENASEA